MKIEKPFVSKELIEKDTKTLDSTKKLFLVRLYDRYPENLKLRETILIVLATLKKPFLSAQIEHRLNLAILNASKDAASI